MLREAPLAFLTVFVLALMASGLGQHYSYRARLESKDASIEAFQSRISLQSDQIANLGVQLAASESHVNHLYEKLSEVEKVYGKEHIANTGRAERPAPEANGRYSLNAAVATPFSLKQPTINIRNANSVPVVVQVRSFFIVSGAIVLAAERKMELQTIHPGEVFPVTVRDGADHTFVGEYGYVSVNILLDYGIERDRLPYYFQAVFDCSIPVKAEAKADCVQTIALDDASLGD